MSRCFAMQRASCMPILRFKTICIEGLKWNDVVIWHLSWIPGKSDIQHLQGLPLRRHLQGVDGGEQADLRTRDPTIQKVIQNATHTAAFFGLRSTIRFLILPAHGFHDGTIQQFIISIVRVCSRY